LDFVCDSKTSHIPLSVEQALAGPAILKVCDPYGHLEDPPLCNKYCSTQSHYFFEITFGSFSNKNL